MMAMPMTEAREQDAVLLARAADGDERAFGTLYEAHRRRLYRLAYGVLLDSDDAREAVQEAFLKLHRAAPRWEPRAQVGTWLYRVVLNHCLGVRGRIARWARPAAERGTARSPEREASAKQAVAIVETSLATLPIRQRAVACLHLEAELSPSELAPLVDMTANAARVSLHRALEKIRLDLAAAGFETPPHDEES